MPTWTPEQLRAYEQRRTNLSAGDTGPAAVVERDGVDTNYRRDNLNPDMPIPYSKEEDAEIIAFYKRHDGAGINLNLLAELIGRSRWSVAMRASRLGCCDSGRPKTDEHKASCAVGQANLSKTPGVSEQRSRSTKAAIAKHGHPRGFLGKKRTQSELNKMKEASMAAWKDPNHRVNSEEYRQAISDRASKIAVLRKPENAFSRAKYGKRADLGEIFFRSAWEANYARYLNWLIKNEGKISRWEYEPETFWFSKIKRGCRSYKPDFKVTLTDNSVEYHEVKGWMYPRAKTALRRMAKYHPSVRVVLIDQFRYKAISKQVGGIIKFWEGKR